MKIEKIKSEQEVVSISREELTHLMAEVIADITEKDDEPCMAIMLSLFSALLTARIFKHK